MHAPGLANSHGSMIRGAVTFTGFLGSLRSNSISDVEVTVGSFTKSEVGARIAPVVENPSSVRNPPAAAFAAASRQLLPSAATDEPASVHAASCDRWPVSGSRSRSNGSGALPRAGSISTLVNFAPIANVVAIASSSCGKLASATGNTPIL
jgi:hypothetical protein